jgi:hypothetical protein
MKHAGKTSIMNATLLGECDAGDRFFKRLIPADAAEICCCGAAESAGW